MSEKLTAKEYAEKLLYTPEYAADKQADVKEKAAAFAEGYKKFMDSAKTEREAAVVSEQMLLAAGYKAFEPKKAYAPGEKVYFIQENKAVVAATIGQKPYEEGFRLVIAHIDCPRLDLRPNPLYESDHMELLPHPLLRRCAQVPVGYHPAGHPRRVHPRRRLQRQLCHW